MTANNGCQDAFPLTLEKRDTILTTITYKEKKNEEAFSRLLNAPKEVLRVIDEKWREDFNIKDYTNEKEQLLTIHAKRDSVKYVMNSSGWGRVMPKKSISIGLVRRKLRHTLCDGVYTDVDIENAHPVILVQAMKSNEVECPRLEKYVNERDDILKKTIEHYGLVGDEDKTPRDKAKNLYIRLMYLGSLNAWAEEHKCKEKEPFLFALEFQNEMERIANKIKEANPDLVKYITRKNYYAKQKNRQTKKIESSVLSLWCQEIERRCLEEMVEVIPQQYRPCLVLCYDGMMIPDSIYEPIMLPEMMKRIHKNLGLRVKITEKEMADKYDVSGYEPANMWYEAMKNKAETKDGLCFVKDLNTFFYRKSTGEWAQCNPKEIGIRYANEYPNFFTEWASDKKRKTYQSVGHYIDAEKCPKNVLNLASPMAFQKFSGKKPEAGFQKIRKHLETLTAGHLKFFEDFLAWRVRKPDDLIPIAFLFYSKPGTGKSHIWEQISRYWFNEDVLIQTNNQDQLGMGAFNSTMKGAMFLNWEEVSGKSGFSKADFMKDQITKSRVSINEKYEKPYSVPNKGTIIINTNNYVSIKIDEADRRFCVFEVPGDAPRINKNPEYFRELAEESENPLSWEAYHYYLKNEHEMNPRITRPSHFQAEIPETEFKREMKEVSIPSIFPFFIDEFKDYDDDTQEVMKYTGSELKSLFSTWCERNKRKVPGNSGLSALYASVECLMKKKSRGVATYTIKVQDFWKEYQDKYES